jgi:hypothetical protein
MGLGFRDFKGLHSVCTCMYPDVGEFTHVKGVIAQVTVSSPFFPPFLLLPTLRSLHL